MGIELPSGCTIRTCRRLKRRGSLTPTEWAIVSTSFTIPLAIMRDALVLVLDHQPLLEPADLMGRDAGGAGVLVALHAPWIHPNENMKPARRGHEIGPRRQRPGDIAGGSPAFRLPPAGCAPSTPIRLRRSVSRGSASRIDMPTRSMSGMGLAPVPPSPPSSVMKSGAAFGAAAVDLLEQLLEGMQMPHNRP